jgi:hypothetical protein
MIHVNTFLEEMRSGRTLLRSDEFRNFPFRWLKKFEFPEPPHFASPIRSPSPLNHPSKP